MFVKIYTFLLLIGISVTIPFFIGEDAKNLLLVTLISLSPFFLLVNKKRYDNVDVLMLMFLVSSLMIYMVHIETFRIQSYVYTFCFVTSFLYLRDFVHRNIITMEFLSKFFKFLIYCYGIVFIAQQLCVLFGVEPILSNVWNPEEKWKLPSLTPEPSHLARFLFFAIYGYVNIEEKLLKRQYGLKDARKDKKFWILYFWMMLTCQSTTAILFSFLFFIRYIKMNTLIQSFVMGAILVGVVLTVFAGNTAFERLLNLIPAIGAQSADAINSVDHSAAHRLLPVFVFKEWFNPLNSTFWFGQGMDSGVNLCRSFMFNISGDGNYLGDTTNIGGFITAFLDNGIIVMCIFIAALIQIFKRIPDKTLVYCWIIVNIFSGINTQMFWFSLFVVMIMENRAKWHTTMHR